MLGNSKNIRISENCKMGNPELEKSKSRKCFLFSESGGTMETNIHIGIRIPNNCSLSYVIYYCKYELICYWINLSTFLVYLSLVVGGGRWW